MNTVNLKTLLRTMIKAKAHVTPMLWGPHGIGKSAIVHQVAAEVGYKALVITLSQKEAVDLAGVLYTYEDKDLGISVTASHPPQWFADAVSRGKLVLFLDEFNMARREVLNASFELVLDRRLNNMRLADDVFVVCAGNPEDDRYDVTPLSESLKDRLMHIQVTPDFNSWASWANTPISGIDQSVLDFLMSTPKASCAVDERDSKFPVEIKQSYRSWERLSRIKQLPVSDEIKLECYRGIVGPNWAIAFTQSTGNDAALSAKEIIENSVSVAEKTKRWLDPTCLRMDCLTVSVNNVLEFCKVSDVVMCSTHTDNVLKFALLLPSDLLASMISSLSSIPGWAKLILVNRALRSRLQETKSVGKAA